MKTLIAVVLTIGAIALFVGIGLLLSGQSKRISDQREPGSVDRHHVEATGAGASAPDGDQEMLRRAGDSPLLAQVYRSRRRAEGGLGARADLDEAQGPFVRIDGDEVDLAPGPAIIRAQKPETEGFQVRRRYLLGARTSLGFATWW